MAAKATTRHRIYLLTVCNGSDRDVTWRLRKLGIKSYAPSTLNQRNDEDMLFPGYVFVWVFDEWERIKCVKGVTGFVRFGEVLARVRAAVIKKLRDTEGPTGFVRWRLFDDGDTVRYGKGGAEVRVLRYESPAQRRVRVLLKILGGRSVEMVVPESDLVAA